VLVLANRQQMRDELLDDAARACSSSQAAYLVTKLDAAGQDGPAEAGVAGSNPAGGTEKHLVRPFRPSGGRAFFLAAHI
jgi:hypothetical protein